MGISIFPALLPVNILEGTYNVVGVVQVQIETMSTILMSLLERGLYE